jgi:hypothetical protein
VEEVMNLNEVVISTKDWSNSMHIIEKFFDSEIFFELDKKFDSLGGQIIKASENIEIQMQYVTVNGGNFSLFYTTKENPRLTAGSIGGVPLVAAIEMILEVPEVDGLLLQSDADRWVAIKKTELTNLFMAIQVGDQCRNP